LGLLRVSRGARRWPNTAVPEVVFSPLNRHFTDRQIVELTVLIGTYNMNARVLRALELDLEA
jgi:alkylhydroperoxidase family enzyme